MVTSQRWIQKTLRGGALRAKAARAKAGVDKNRKVGSWEDPTNLVQSVSMGFLHVQRTFSLLLLGGLGHAPRKVLKIRYNEIEFGSNFD